MILLRHRFVHEMSAVGDYSRGILEGPSPWIFISRTELHIEGSGGDDVGILYAQ